MIGYVVMFGGAFALSASMLIAVALTRVRVDHRGVTEPRLGGGQIEIGWPEVAAVRFSALWESFLIRTRDGRSLRVSAISTGGGGCGRRFNVTPRASRRPRCSSSCRRCRRRIPDRAQPRRWRAASNSRTPAATDTLRLSTPRAIGMATEAAARDRAAGASPAPSGPRRIATGSRRSASL